MDAENVEPTTQGIDGSAFANRTWLPRNISASDFVAGVRHSDIVAGLPGYIVFDGVPYRLSDAMTAEMCLKYTRDQSAPRISMKEDGPWLSTNGFEFSDASAPAGLGSGESIVIGAEGFNEWRKVDAARVFSAAIPESGRIIVITSSEAVLYDSLMDGPKDMVLPEGSYVGFAGPMGVEFKLK